MQYITLAFDGNSALNEFDSKVYVQYNCRNQMRSKSMNTFENPASGLWRGQMHITYALQCCERHSKPVFG